MSKKYEFMDYRNSIYKVEIEEEINVVRKTSPVAAKMKKTGKKTNPKQSLA